MGCGGSTKDKLALEEAIKKHEDEIQEFKRREADIREEHGEEIQELQKEHQETKRRMSEEKREFEKELMDDLRTKQEAQEQAEGQSQDVKDQMEDVKDQMELVQAQAEAQLHETQMLHEREIMHLQAGEQLRSDQRVEEFRVACQKQMDEKLIDIEELKNKIRREREDSKEALKKLEIVIIERDELKDKMVHLEEEVARRVNEAKDKAALRLQQKMTEIEAEYDNRLVEVRKEEGARAKKLAQELADLNLQMMVYRKKIDYMEGKSGQNPYDGKSPREDPFFQMQMLLKTNDRLREQLWRAQNSRVAGLAHDEKYSRLAANDEKYSSGAGLANDEKYAYLFKDNQDITSFMDSPKKDYAGMRDYPKQDSTEMRLYPTRATSAAPLADANPNRSEPLSAHNRDSGIFIGEENNTFDPKDHNKVFDPQDRNKSSDPKDRNKIFDRMLNLLARSQDQSRELARSNHELKNQLHDVRSRGGSESARSAGKFESALHGNWGSPTSPVRPQSARHSFTHRRSQSARSPQNRGIPDFYHPSIGSEFTLDPVYGANPGEEVKSVFDQAEYREIRIPRGETGTRKKLTDSPSCQECLRVVKSSGTANEGTPLPHSPGCVWGQFVSKNETILTFDSAANPSSPIPRPPHGNKIADLSKTFPSASHTESSILDDKNLPYHTVLEARSGPLDFNVNGEGHIIEILSESCPLTVGDRLHRVNGHKFVETAKTGSERLELLNRIRPIVLEFATQYPTPGG